MDFIHLDVDTSSFRKQNASCVFPRRFGRFPPVAAVALRSLVSHSSFCEGGKTDSVKVIFVLEGLAAGAPAATIHSTQHSFAYICRWSCVCVCFFFSFLFSLLVQKVLPWSITAGEVKKKITKPALFISSAMCGIMFPRVRVHWVFLIWINGWMCVMKSFQERCRCCLHTNWNTLHKWLIWSALTLCIIQIALCNSIINIH